MKQIINKIYCQDNLEVLKTLPSESIDTVITDPYFEVMSIGHSKATKQDQKSNFIEVCKLLIEIMKPNSNLVFFCAQSWMLDNYKKIKDIGFNFQYELIWNKNRGVSFLTAKKRPLQKHETIYVFSKGDVVYYYDQAKTLGHKPTKRGKYTIEKDYVNIKTNEHKNDGERFMTTVLDYKVSSYNKHTSHPFEKPVDISQQLVKAYSKKDDIVLDPYSGSGNICLAAVLLGRNYIGIEIDKSYYEESVDNLKKMFLRYEIKDEKGLDKFIK